jgi:hypothetical protein
MAAEADHLNARRHWQSDKNKINFTHAGILMESLRI